MSYDSPGKKLWRYISPILLYYGVMLVVSFIGSFVITYQLAGSMASMDMEEFTQELILRSLEASVPIYLISGLAALPFLIRMFFKDMTYRKYVGDKAGLKKWTLVYCLLAGVFCSLAASLLAALSQAGQIFEGYENASQTIFSQSVLMQIVAAGVVMPIVEEYIFRGLMYNRMKDYMSANMAMIISSVIFGLYHGNLIQGVYGFVMGLLMIFVYEKYQTMLAPVLCHIGANMISIVLQFLNIQLDSVMVAVMAAAVCLVAAYLLLRLIQKQIHVGTVLNKRYINAGLDSNTSYGNHTDYFTNNDSSRDRSASEGTYRKSGTGYSVDDYYPKTKDDNQE